MAAPSNGRRDRREWDDARLVEASRAGDGASWAVLYARHLDYTRAVAARRTADQASSEDAVAVGWARAFERLASLRDPAKFRPWVAAAVAHAALDESRRTQRVVPSDDLTALAGEEDPVADAGVAAADRASRAIFARRAFLALPERHRKVLAMALVDDLSPKQIAATLDMDPNAVSQLLHRAKNGLRRSYLRARLPDSTPEPCRRAHELTIDYARGDDSVRPEITGHLAECDFCAARLTEVLSTRSGAWALFGATPIALLAVSALPRKTISAVRAAFQTGLDGIQSGVQGVTSLPMPVAGAFAGGSAVVVAAVVTVSTGIVPLPPGQSGPANAPVAAAQPASAGSSVSPPPVTDNGFSLGTSSAHGGGGTGADHGTSPSTTAKTTSTISALLTTTTAKLLSSTTTTTTTTIPTTTTTTPATTSTTVASSALSTPTSATTIASSTTAPPASDASTNPTDVTTPTDPTTAPTDPTTAPTDPTTAPTDPTTAPTDPTTAPTDPTTSSAPPTTPDTTPTTVEPVTTAPPPTTASPPPTTATAPHQPHLHLGHPSQGCPPQSHRPWACS